MIDRLFTWASAPSTARQRLVLACAFAAVALLCAGLAATSTVPKLQAAPRYDNAANPTYLSPLELTLSRDGQRLYVLCQQSDEVLVLNAATLHLLARIAVGHQPRGMALSPSGDLLYVTNSWDDSVSVLSLAHNQVEATLPVAAEPSGVALDRSSLHLFVANRISGDVAVLNARTGVEQKRLLAGRGSSYITASPDGHRLYATHVYPNPGAHRTAPQSEVTVINADDARVQERIPLPSIAGVFHLAFSPDGSVAAVATYHPKNLVPLAHLEHGGAFAYTLTLFGTRIGRPVEIPLDELERYSAQPFAVVFSADGQTIYVSASASESVVALSVPRILHFLKTHERPASGSFATDLAASSNYITARIPVGRNPRGLALNASGSVLYVANRLDDTISLINTHTNQVQRTVQLANIANYANVTNSANSANVALRRGEQAFYTARYSFQGQISCSTCHIDSTFDGLTWDLEPDGFGRDIVDNRPIEDLKGTEPFKWNGGNPDVPTECGPRTEKYFWRSEQYDNRTLTDLALYMRHLKARPNRYRVHGQPTAAQERGQMLFRRTVDRFGKAIPEANRCSFCHSGSKGTNQQIFDVGTGSPTDNTGRLDTPQLTNIALSSPYLHDGSAATLEEIWTLYNPDDKHGRTSDLTKDELNDLIEYLRTR